MMGMDDTANKIQDAVEGPVRQALIELVGVETLSEVDQGLGTIRDAAGPLHGLQLVDPIADAVEQAMREALGDVPVTVGR